MSKWCFSQGGVFKRLKGNSIRYNVIGAMNECFCDDTNIEANAQYQYPWKLSAFTRRERFENLELHKVMPWYVGERLEWRCTKQNDH